MDPFIIAGQRVKPGTRKQIELATASLYDFTPMTIPLEVIHGRKEGPVLLVCAAIHGDEINGVDIVRRLLKHRRVRSLSGTLIAVPIVNVFGFNTKSRYLPDRRDLNRCFPGDRQGSLAAQLAHILLEEVISKATHCIDLHTGAIHRSNLPQIRGCFDEPETLRLAEAFGVPVMINAALRDGSLREAARECNIPTLLFEGGEALRFNDAVARTGLRGILHVMEEIGMLARKDSKHAATETFHAKDSHWLRAPQSGIMQVKKKLGDRVSRGELLATISDPFGVHRFEIRARQDGIVVGMSMLPLFNKGDAVFHIATFEDAEQVEENIEQYQQGIAGQADTFVM